MTVSILEMQKDAAIRLKQERASRFGAVWWDDIDLDTRSETFVKGLLVSGGMSVVYGESGCGKSFFTSDLALHGALGWEWRGRKVQQGGVVYIAAEGGNGMKKRLAAFRQHHGVTRGRVPFLLIPTAVNLLDPEADAGDLIAEIEAAAIMAGVPIRLVVVDTLSRAIAGGNENASDDMGAFVRNCDRIREATGAHLCIVHHSGKDGAKGARGHSLLRAATDTEIEIKRDEISGTITAKVTKQKDGDEGDEFAFQLERVELGHDEDGDPITSCVVAEADAAPVRRGPKLSPAAKMGLERLCDALADFGQPSHASRHIPSHVQTVTLDQWKERLMQTGIINADGGYREQFRRIRHKLLEAGRIAIWQDHVWLVRERHTPSHGVTSPVTGGVTSVTPPYKGCDGVTVTPQGGNRD